MRPISETRVFYSKHYILWFTYSPEHYICQNKISGKVRKLQKYCTSKDFRIIQSMDANRLLQFFTKSVSGIQYILLGIIFFVGVGANMSFAAVGSSALPPSKSATGTTITATGSTMNEWVALTSESQKKILTWAESQVSVLVD